MADHPIRWRQKLGVAHDADNTFVRRRDVALTIQRASYKYRVGGRLKEFRDVVYADRETRKPRRRGG